MPHQFLLTPPLLFFPLDFLLSTCPSLFAAVHPPPSILVLSPGSVAVLMKLTDISSLAVDSLERAKAYGDYLPIKEGPQDQHALCQQLQASLNSQSLLSWNILSHFSSLGDCRSTSTFLPLSAFLVRLPPSMSYPPTMHICFLFLSLSFSLSLSIAPTYPVVIMEKSVIVLEGVGSTFSLIKDIYGM